MKTISIRSFNKEDWVSVSRIYAEGINTGIATFETKVPTWEQWHRKYISSCRIVAASNSEVVGFAVLSQVSKRDVYSGVAEVSVYVASSFKRQHIGEALLIQLIN